MADASEMYWTQHNVHTSPREVIDAGCLQPTKQKCRHTIHTHRSNRYLLVAMVETPTQGAPTGTAVSEMFASLHTRLRCIGISWGAYTLEKAS